MGDKGLAGSSKSFAILDYYPGLVKVRRNSNVGEEEEEEVEVGDDETSQALLVPDAQQVALELDRAAALIRKPDAEAEVKPRVAAEEGGGDAEEGERDEFAVTVADPGPGKVEERVYRQGVWSLNESIVLLDAKKREREILSGSKRNSISADEKWKAVAEFCWSHGVHRSKEQCRFKWENTMPDFKKVRDYEYERAEADKSYFDMENWQRKERHLPPNLSKELYTIMDSFHAGGTSKRLLSSSSSAKKEVRAAKLATATFADGGTQESVAVDNSLEGDRDAKTTEAPGEEKAEARVGRRKRRRVVVEELPKVDSQPPKAASGDGHGTSDMSRLEGLSSAARASEDTGGAGMEAAMRPEASILGGDGGEAFAHGGGAKQRTNLAPSAEDRKEARHRELVALEREKLVANKEAMGLVATALNNVATAFVRVADLLQQR